MTEEFIAEIDRAMVAAGYSNRSQFIRDAVVEKLRNLGVDVPVSLTIPKPRVQSLKGDSGGAALAEKTARAAKLLEREPRSDKA